MNFQEQQQEDTIDLLQQLQVMRSKELNQAAYECFDYFSFYDRQDTLKEDKQKHPKSPVSVAHSPKANCTNLPLECRRKMVEWSQQVIDWCDFDKEVLFMAIRYVDCYVCQKVTQVQPNESSASQKERLDSILMDKKKFQLLVMTCLYLATKAYDTKNIDCQILVRVSRGVYTTQDFIQMEQEILTTLNWRLYSPTASAFLHQFIRIFSLSSLLVHSECCTSNLDDAQRKMDYTMSVVEKMAENQLVWAIGEAEFVSVDQSILGFCAFSNALEYFYPGFSFFTNSNTRKFVDVCGWSEEYCYSNQSIQHMKQSLSLHMGVLPKKDHPSPQICMPKNNFTIHSNNSPISYGCIKMSPIAVVQRHPSITHNKK